MEQEKLLFFLLLAVTVLGQANLATDDRSSGSFGLCLFLHKGLSPS